MKNIKKAIALILTVCVIVCTFVACSSKKEDKTTTKSTTSTTVQITTESAVINDSDAVNLIKSYSAKELGLTKKQYKSASFMVNSRGFELDGKDGYYILVAAAEKKETGTNKDGNKTYSLKTLGDYYISYDGKEVLREVSKDGKKTYVNLEVKEVTTAKAK